MRVREVMVGTPYTCPKDANLGVATEMMWKANCGFLPVTEPGGRVCGVITDRDICMALGTRNKLAGQVKVEEVMSHRLYACLPDDEIHVALLTMREGRVRRLPVLDADKKIVGVLSMDDVLLHAEGSASGKVVELSTDEVVRTYRAINRRDLPQVVKKLSVAA